VKPKPGLSSVAKNLGQALITQPFRVSKGPKSYWRRQNLGWLKDGDSLKPCHFLLGKDQTKAAERAALLERMWNTIVARWEKYKETAEPSWETDTYAIAKAVARGETDIVVEVPETIRSTAESMGDGPAAFIGIWLEGLRQMFPFLQLRLADKEWAEEVEAESTKLADSLEQDADQTLDMARQIRGLASGQQLHQALDAYAAYVREKYAEKGRYLLTQIALIRQHRKDHPLSQLDGDMIETWLTYWCRRPKSFDSQKPLAFATCRNVLIALRQFLRWLNRSPKFKWQLPHSFSFPRCKIVRLPEDLVKKRKYFKRDELTEIWQQAKPWDRALILLALNCGFSKREIATLQTAEIVQKKGHTYIKRIRTKTMVRTDNASFGPEGVSSATASPR
jgi:integrase